MTRTTPTESEFLARYPPPGTSTPEHWELAVRRALRYHSEGVSSMSVESILQDEKDGRQAFPTGPNPAGIISDALMLLWHDDVRSRSTKSTK